MNRRLDWLKDHELADPDETTVQHITHGETIDRYDGLCGALLNGPAPDAPICSRCAAVLRSGALNGPRRKRLHPMNASTLAARLLSAYRRLCDRNRPLAYVAVLGLTIDSVLALVITAVWFPRWAPLPALALIVSAVLLHFAPGDDDPIDDPDDDESDGAR